MPRFSVRPSIAALALAAALTLPGTALASPPAGPPAAASFFWQLWGALTGLWAPSVLPDDGCSMDPNGRCLAGSVATAITPDSGCSMDPNGRCLPGSTATAITPDDGCSWDPDGRCSPGR